MLDHILSIMLHLFSPLPLRLGVLREQVLRDNLDVLLRNGFQFEFDDSKEFGSQARMTHTPGDRFTSDGRNLVAEGCIFISFWV